MPTDLNGELLVFLDGAAYDFTRFACVRSLALLCVKAFKAGRSKGASPEARKKTNATEASRISTFLKFAAQHDIRHLDADVCRQYIAYLRRTFSATTEWNYYNSFKAVVAYAIRSKSTEDFLVPRCISKAKAASSKRDQITLADLYVADAKDQHTHADINRMLIRLLENFCWRRIIQIRNRQRQGYAWRNEPECEKDILQHNSRRLQSREEHLRRIVRHYWNVSEGFYGYHAMRVSGQPTRTRVARYISENKLDVTWEEITDYLRHTPQMLGAFMILYAIERMNSDMILALTAEMMKDDPLRPNRKTIYIEKRRANEEYSFGPYKVGSVDARTIPQAWYIQQEILDRSLDQSRYLTPKMFSAFAITRDGLKLRRIENAALSMKGLQRAISEETDPEFEPLRRIKGKISLKLIRTTVINVDRRSGSFSGAVKKARHKSGSTTAVYLKNSAMRAAYEEEIEAGQNYLIKLAQSATLINVDKSPASLASKHNLSIDTAQRLLNDELNAGYGVSFVQEHAFIICVELNALRLLTWVSTLERARDRLVRENPERWERVWLPQLALCKQALADFPRKMLAQALGMKERSRIVFPEPY